jgi:hypothetical protein
MCHSSSTPALPPAVPPLAVLSGEEIMGAATGTSGCISPAHITKTFSLSQLTRDGYRVVDDGAFKKERQLSREPRGQYEVAAAVRRRGYRGGAGVCGVYRAAVVVAA